MQEPRSKSNTRAKIIGKSQNQRQESKLKVRTKSKARTKIKNKNQNQRQEPKSKARTKIKVLGDSGMERASRLRTAGGSADLFAAWLRQD